jgi:chemotaxis-related protein WspB
MLLLLFCLQEERYAIPSRQVLEIIPLVDLQPIHQSPSDIPGFFNYRGCIVPVIDLCQRLKGQSSRPHLSTRIILVDLQAKQRSEQEPEGSSAGSGPSGLPIDLSRRAKGEAAPTGSILGLMAERVTDTIHSQDAGLLSRGLQVGDNPMLGNMLQDHQGLIQVLNLSHILDNPQAGAVGQDSSGLLGQVNATIAALGSRRSAADVTGPTTRDATDPA